MYGVSVKHNFETAHRLYTIPGKCQNLHGHSWNIEIRFEAEELDVNGMVVDFGALKSEIRTWIDRYWDHGAILCEEDPLCSWLLDNHSKVYPLPFLPTVEHVAQEASAVFRDMLVREGLSDHVKLVEVTLQETATNKAYWTA